MSPQPRIRSTCRPVTKIVQTRRLLIVIILVIIFARPTEDSLHAMQPDGNGPQRLPTIPRLEPRSLNGQAVEQQIETHRSDDERTPVGAYVKSLYGADAVIEVIVGQGRLITTRRPIANENGTALIAVGDPSIVDFEVLPNPRMVRLIAKRPGITDLVINTADDQLLTFEVHAVYDIALLQTRLRHLYPDSQIRLSQLRDHIVLEGQARNARQAAMIEEALSAFLSSLAVSSSSRTERTARASGIPQGGGVGPQRQPSPSNPPFQSDVPADDVQLRATLDVGMRGDAEVRAPAPRIINLMAIPGVQQVMLQVRVAELNRTALRRVGADLFVESGSGNRLGTNLGVAETTLNGIVGLGTNSTAFGVFPSGAVQVVLDALRDNSVLNVLAEPNLMALNGERASFLAGGQFPIPVPQGGGLEGAVTIVFKDFGVSLNFVPYILDENTIRLQVSPEVSSIDESLGTTLVVGGDPVPGISTRRVETTVELGQGQTLALAGLLQVELDARTQRIPGLGDLPYLGPLFSNTSHKRVEKELLVLVTPYLVQPMTPDQVGPLPGAEVEDPNDLEFYLLNRIEGRTGRNFRSTTSWSNPLHLVELMKLERKHVCGPVGHSD